MATHIKTIEYSFPTLDTGGDNIAQVLSQITAYIPEFSSSVTFRSVLFTISWKEGAGQTTGNYNVRRLDLSIGGGSSTVYVSNNLYTGSGENTQVFHTVNATSQFVSEWTTGTSKTLDCVVLIDGTATTINWVDIEVTCFITYEYDDTVSTQIKTVYIPLDCPTGALGTGTDTDCGTIPNLDTLLPEASKVYRDLFIVFQGNVVSSGSIADRTYTFKYNSTTIRTTQLLEMGATSDYWSRFIVKGLGTIPTNASSTFYVNQSNTGRTNHPQAYIVVTYEFDATSSNDYFVSMMLPMEIPSPMGISAASFQRAEREFWIQETGIANQQIAFYSFWDQQNAIGGLRMRIGTGSFIAYTDTAAVLCGGNGAMTRNDSAITLQHGRNIIKFDIYNTDVTDLGFNVSGFWIINYTCDKPSSGYSACNKTIKLNYASTSGAAARYREISASQLYLPTTSYWLNAVGTNYQYITNSTGNAAGVTVLTELTAAEGGLKWLPAYTDIGGTDPETGLRQCWSQVRSIFKRWKSGSLNDVAEDRVLPTTPRRWLCVLAASTLSFDHLDMYYTYHAITYQLTGSISGSSGGAVTIDLHRNSNGEKVLSTTRVGNGAFSFDWFDDTEDLFVVAYESDTHKGRSKTDISGSGFDISLSDAGGSGGGEYFF